MLRISGGAARGTNKLRHRSIITSRVICNEMRGGGVNMVRRGMKSTIVIARELAFEMIKLQWREADDAVVEYRGAMMCCDGEKIKSAQSVPSIQKTN